jgi:hypothetical protein
MTGLWWCDRFCAGFIMASFDGLDEGWELWRETGAEFSGGSGVEYSGVLYTTLIQDKEEEHHGGDSC